MKEDSSERKFEEEKEEIEEQILYECDDYEDIVIVSDQIGKDNYDFSITDDESSYDISVAGKKIGDDFYPNSTGFVTVVSAKEFIKNFKDIGGGYDDPVDENKYFDDNYFSHFVVRNFKGKAKLRVLIEGVGYVDTTGISDYIWHDTKFDKYKDEDEDIYLQPFVDVECGQVVELDKKLYDELKLKVHREAKLTRIVVFLLTYLSFLMINNHKYKQNN